MIEAPPDPRKRRVGTGTEKGWALMNSGALFGLSVLMNFIASGIVAKLYIWPRLRAVSREEALLPLVMPHMFRFIGLSFLVPGVVSGSLSPDFARPAAYGDLGAAVLAIIAVFAVSARVSWALPMVWIFNLWSATDLLYAIYQGEIGVRIGAGSLGAAFYIPTVLVPPLLITHGLIFWLLRR
jgi:hypothetical protein